MVSNPKFYPQDFPSTAATGTQTLTNDVQRLTIESRRAAVQSVYGRRQNSQGIARQENSRVIVVGDYMPQGRVGRAAVSAADRVIGDLGMFISAAPDDTTIDEISLQSMILHPSGSELIKSRSGVICFHDGYRGFVAGGTHWYTEMRKVRHMRTETRTRWV
jgi:hypothetical protein